MYDRSAGMNESLFVSGSNNNFFHHLAIFVVSGLCILQSLSALRGALTIPESASRSLTFYTIYLDPTCDRCIEKGKSLWWSVIGFGVLAFHLSRQMLYQQPVNQAEFSNGVSATARAKMIFARVRRSKVKAIALPTFSTIAFVVHRTTSLHVLWTFDGAGGNLTRDILLFVHVFVAYVGLYLAFVLATIGYLVWFNWCRTAKKVVKDKLDDDIVHQQEDSSFANSTPRRRRLRVFLTIMFFTVLSFTLLDINSNTRRDAKGVEELPTPFDRNAPSFLRAYPDIYDMRSTATGGKYTYDCSAFNDTDSVTPEVLETQDDDTIPLTSTSAGEFEEELLDPVAAYVPRWFARLLAKPQFCPPSTRVVPEFSHYGESPNNQHAVIVAGKCPGALATDGDNDGMFGSSVAGNIGSESYPRPLFGGGSGVGIAPELKARKYKRTQRSIIVVEDLEANFLGKMAHRTRASSSRADGSETCGFETRASGIGGKIGENWQRRVNERYGGVDQSKAGKSVPFYCRKTKRKYIVSRNDNGHVHRVVIDLNDVEARQMLRVPANEVLQEYTDASPNTTERRKRQRREMLKFYTALGLNTKWTHHSQARSASTKKPASVDESDHVYVYTLEPGARLVTVLCGDVEEFHVGRLPHTNGTRHFSTEERLLEAEAQTKKEQQSKGVASTDASGDAKHTPISSSPTETFLHQKPGSNGNGWKHSKAWRTRKHQRVPKVNGIHVIFLDAISRPGVLRQLPRTVKWLRKRSFDAMMANRKEVETQDEEERTSDPEQHQGMRHDSTAAVVEFPGFTTVNPNTIGNMNALLGGHTIQDKFEDSFELLGHGRQKYNLMNEAHYKRYLRENNIFAKAKERYLVHQLFDDDGAFNGGRRAEDKKIMNWTHVDRIFTAFVHEHAEDSQELYWGSSSSSTTTGHGDHHRDIDAHYISHAAHRFNCEESNFEGLNSIQRRCFGRREAVEVNVQLAHSLVNQAMSQDKRFLIFTHFLEGHEVTLTQGDAQDDHLVRYFHELERDGFFENNVVILMSDHGNHMGPQIELASRVGHMERTMPFLSLLLPQHLARKHQHALQTNREQLVGAFDIHGTILDILGLDDELPEHASRAERENDTFYCTSVRLGGHNATRTTRVAVPQDHTTNGDDSNSAADSFVVKETYKRIPSLMRPFDIKRNTCRSVRAQQQDCVLSKVCRRKKMN